MPYQRPSLATLVGRAQADIRAGITGTAAAMRRSVLGVLARMHAGVTHGLYGYINWVSLQLFPDTADEPNLRRWAGIWGVRPVPGVAATGDVTFAGSNGAVVVKATRLQANDGTLYTTDADTTIAGGEASVSVTADEVGDDGNQDAGASLSLISPVAGVRSQATVASGGLRGGAAATDSDRLLSDLLARIQAPPQGGETRDYNKWAREAHPAVTDVWPSPKEMGIGTITVRFMTYGATPNGIPTSPVVDAVKAHVQKKRPVTADVYVVAPIAQPLDIHISDLDPDEQVVKNAIEVQLADLIRREASPGGTILISHIREAISLAAGEYDHALVSPVADVTVGAGYISTMGDVTWG